MLSSFQPEMPLYPQYVPLIDPAFDAVEIDDEVSFYAQHAESAEFNDDKSYCKSMT